jgi:hypothetical protein
MDFKDQIKQSQIELQKLKDQIATEESHQNAFIKPFIQTLGFDVFNPLGSSPRNIFVSIGTKKEKRLIT